MRRLLLILIILCLALQGCVALHYTNTKGLGAQAKDVQVKAAKIEKGKAAFSSTIDLWVFFPWKFKVDDVEVK